MKHRTIQSPEDKQLNAAIVERLEAAAAVIVKASPAAQPARSSKLAFMASALRLASRSYSLEELKALRKPAFPDSFDTMIFEAQRLRLTHFASPQLKPEICAAIEAAGLEGVSIRDGKIFVSVGRVSCWAGSNIFAQIDNLKRLS